MLRVGYKGMIAFSLKLQTSHSWKRIEHKSTASYGFIHRFSLLLLLHHYHYHYHYHYDYCYCFFYNFVIIIIIIIIIIF